MNKLLTNKVESFILLVVVARAFLQKPTARNISKPLIRKGEKNMKKRAFALIAVLTILASMLVGCGEIKECDFCEKTRRCKSEEVFGEEIWYCSDCEKELKEFYEDLNGLTDWFE